jgi:hypothetical protein
MNGKVMFVLITVCVKEAVSRFVVVDLCINVFYCLYFFLMIPVIKTIFKPVMMVYSNFITG